MDFFDKHLKKSKEANEINTVNQRKIWNISLKNWDVISDNQFPNYEFGLQSDGTANFEIIDGSLLLNAKGSGSFSIVHDPWRPSQGDGGHLGPNPGLFDRDFIDKRLDVGVFQTNYLKEDLYFSGVPILETFIKSDQPCFDICLALSLVSENEKTVSQFTTGFLRVKNAQTSEESYCKIAMHPTNISLLKGTKLRLSISAAAYPAIGVNSGFGDDNLGAPTINHKITTLSFELSKTIMKMTPFFN